MKVFKSLLLGSAAGLAAVAAAQAADLPSRKSAPVEYVKICDAYGAGFFYIPGTDTCLKVGGYVRAEYDYATPGNIVTVPTFNGSAAVPLAITGAGSIGANGFPVVGSSAAYAASFNAAYQQVLGRATFLPAGTIDQTGFQARGRVELDARTQTAFGTARTFIGLRVAYGSGLYANGDNYTTNTFVSQGAASVTLENAIIQFAGFTFGHTPGDVYSYLPSEYYNVLESYGSPAGFNLLAYTATFGGGFSATIGIEDRSNEGYATIPGYVPTLASGQIVSTSGFTTSQTGGISNGPLTWPVLMANLRVDQSWGNAQIMGAVAQNEANTPAAAGFGVPYNAAGTQTFVPNPAFPAGFTQTLDKVGFAIGAGVRINLPFFAPGDHLYITGAYADGFLDGLSSQNTSSHTGDIGRTIPGFQRIDRNMTVIPNADGTFSTESTTGYSVSAILTHYWTPTLRSLLLGGYEHLDPGDRTQATDWSLGGLRAVDIYSVAGQLVWTPTANLEIGGEVSYSKLDQNLLCVNTASCAALNYLTNTLGARQGDDVIQTRLRVTRQF